MIGTWVAGALALLLILRTAARLLVSSGHKRLASAIRAQAKDRARLFVPASHEWCARAAHPSSPTHSGQLPASLPAAARRVRNPHWKHMSQACSVCHEPLLLVEEPVLVRARGGREAARIQATSKGQDLAVC